MNDVKNVLITGGLGYIGAHIAYTLLSQGCRVVVFDQHLQKKLGNIKVLQQFSNFEIIEGNIVDYNFASYFQQATIDTIIHCAGKKSLIESWASPELYNNINVNGTKNLIQHLSPTIKNFLLLSTSMLYANQAKDCKEDSLVNTDNPYAKSKHEQELLVKELSSNVNVAVLRCFNIIGCLDGLRENVDSSSTLIPAIIKASQSDEPVFNIYGNSFNTPDGTSVRDYLHVKDLTSFVRACLDFLTLQQQGFNLWNVGSAKGLSVKEIITIFEDITGKKFTLQHLDSRQGEKPRLVANIDKAFNDLAWHPQESVRAACICALKNS